MKAAMRFSALGDIACLLPLLRVMEPQPCIITSPLGKAFLKDEFSDFLVMPNKSAVSHLRLIRDIRRRKFSDLIDFQGNDRARFFSAFSGCFVHNGCDPAERHRPFSQLVKQLQQEARERMVFERKPESYIILNTGSSAKWASKRLPVTKWVEFARLLNERYALPLKLTGSADEVDYVSTIAKELPGDIEVMAGKTSLTELKKVIRGAFLTVSTDSAAIHISAVEKTPVIGLFGATTWERFNYVPWAVALYDHTFYANIKAPTKSLAETRNYYDHIHLEEGLTALKKYLS
jgi:ADP-heptose:LPS heptosyltransferase